MLLEITTPWRKLTEQFVSFLATELNVIPERLVLAEHEGTDGNLGLCIDLSDTEFMILVKTDSRNIGEIFTTIAHEMIHVKQYMQENLGWFLDNRSYIPYQERWWEKEAFQHAVPLVEKFAKGLDK